jgi:hypothetical protein
MGTRAKSRSSLEEEKNVDTLPFNSRFNFEARCFFGWIFCADRDLDNLQREWRLPLCNQDSAGQV